MTALTKARQRVDTIARSSHEIALSLKKRGLLEALSPDIFAGTFGAWTEQAKGRERYASFRGVLYAAVNAIGVHGAGQPVRVGMLKKAAKGKPGSTKGYKTKPVIGTKRILGRKGADEIQVVEDHPLVEVMENPNPFQNRWQFTYSFLTNINLTGKAFIVGEQYKGRLQLYSLPTTWMNPIVDQDKGLTGWRVGDPGMPISMHEEFKPNQVVYAYLPHPGDPRGAYAPAESQMPAIRVDDKIWSSREVFFDNGIFPGCIVTVGQNPHPEAGSQGGRPLLTATQRGQVNAAIKKVMGGVTNYGNPAIVDGLIESIDRLSMNSEEMGWERSSAETKTAILSAFCVHPYILGEHMPGSMAQARIIKELFYERVNVFLDMLGNCVSTFVGSMGGDETVYVWWEPKEFVDIEMQWRRMMDMRRNHDVTQNEVRAEAGLPPDEDGNENMLGQQAAAVIQILMQKGQGMVTVEQGVAFVRALGLPDKMAEDIIGEEVEQPPQGAPGTPPGAGPGPEGNIPGPQPEAPQGPSSGDLSGDLAKAVQALREAPLDVSSAVARMIVDAAWASEK